MNRRDTLVALAAMSALWPSYRLPDDDRVLEVAIGAAQRQWADLHPDAVQAAIAVLAAEGREFAPPVGLVGRRAAELVAEARGQRLPDADEAWAEVRTQVQRRGRWAAFSEDPLVWSHPLVGQAVERFGWESLCGSTNEVADRAHFLRMYDQARERATLRSITARALGELGRGSIDFELPAPPDTGQT